MSQRVKKVLRQSSLWLHFERRVLRKYAEPHREAIEATAALLRQSELFDAENYAARTACRRLGYDPAFHYVLSGEGEGYATRDFDPVFYAQRYGDVAASGGNRLVHYLTVGRQEGRYATRAQRDAPVPKPARVPDRPIVYVVNHEASRTGAPILGWNLCRLLRQRYFVVAIVFSGGSLLEAFAATSDLVVAAPSVPADRQGFMQTLLTNYPPAFAIVNSLWSKKIVSDLVARSVPFVGLVQEFAPPDRDPEMQELFTHCRGLVFASQLIMEGSTRYYDVDPQKCHLQPQGRSLLPPITENERGKSATDAETRAVLAPVLATVPRPFLVAGVGSVESRKGVDLFLATATALMNARPDLDVRFVWIGARARSGERAPFNHDIDVQIERSGLGEHFFFLRPADDLQSVYAAMDLLFLCSRLDPMPNVAIDAAFFGKPVLCFRGATGFADVLRDNDLEQLTLSYLDLVAATEAIAALADAPQTAAALGMRLRAVAEETFVMERYLAAIEALAAGADAAQATPAEATV